MAGEARAILSKAEVVAREAGVDHDSVAVTSNRPYEAILEAAEARGCDLIFIASHGRRGLKGLVLGSQTQRVLQHTTIPVLVSAVESNLPAGELISAIGHDRRRASLARGGDPRPRVPGPRSARRGEAAVVRVCSARCCTTSRSFPRRCTIRRRTRTCSASCASARRSSTRRSPSSSSSTSAAGSWSKELEQSIDRYETDPADGFDAFAAAVARFASDQMQHMRLESKVILPAAREHLTAEDWAEIDRAFADNGDPRFSADNDEEFRQLFTRILNLAPDMVVGAGAQRLTKPARKTKP